MKKVIMAIALALLAALALAACASSPSLTPKAATAQDSAALQPFTRTFNFSWEQNNSFNFLDWDMTDTATPARTHYQRYPFFSRNYEYYALTSAIMSLITSVTFATVSIIWILGYW
jgi:hypothetical protein